MLCDSHNSCLRIHCLIGFKKKMEQGARMDGLPRSVPNQCPFSKVVEF